MKCSEYKELVAAHADRQLPSTELERADDHARACPPCEALHSGQIAVKGLLARRRATQVAPDSLRHAIARSTAVHTAPVAKRARPTRLILGGAIAALLLLSLIPLLRGGGSDLVGTMASDIARIDNIAPQLATSNLAELRAFYAHRGMTFEQTVPDLDPYGIRLVGGSISHVGDVMTTLTIYDSNGTPVICRRFPADQIDLPSGGRVFNRSRLFEREGVHISLTNIEGGVVCAMASRMPFEQLFASAHANQTSLLR